MIEIKNLTKTFKNKVAVNNVTFDIKKGEVTGIIGPNGSGKSTIINCLLDIYDYEGEIKYDNVVLINSIFAYCPDELLLPNKLTGKEYTKFILSLYEVNDFKKLDNLLLVYDMEKAFDNLIETYSFGMKKKLQLICAFALDTPYIVMDEPFRGLDIEAIHITKKLIENLIKKGVGVFISSHDLHSIQRMCDKVIVLSNSEILFEGTPKYLVEKYGVNNLEDLFISKAVSNSRKEVINEVINNI